MDENKRGSVRVEPSRKRVRAYLADHLVADVYLDGELQERPRTQFA